MEGAAHTKEEAAFPMGIRSVAQFSNHFRRVDIGGRFDDVFVLEGDEEAE